MRAVRFHDAARLELVNEVRYYAGISPRLGERLVTAVEDAISLAIEFPEIGSPYKYGTRRVFPRRFPYSIVYLVRESEIFILALARSCASLATGARAR